MTTLPRILLAALLAAAAAGGCGDGNDTPPGVAATTLDALRAARDAPYGVPETGDVGLTVRISLAATAYAQLSDEQLLAWAELWRDARARADRPRVDCEEPAPEGGVSRVNLFDRIPKDGFCVAYAKDMEGLANAKVRAFLESVR